MDVNCCVQALALIDTFGAYCRQLGNNPRAEVQFRIARD